MKTRTKNPAAQTIQSPTSEEIRRRAHEIFLARGGTPGSELDDWMRAEQLLKRERATSKTAVKEVKDQ